MAGEAQSSRLSGSPSFQSRHSIPINAPRSFTDVVRSGVGASVGSEKVGEATILSSKSVVLNLVMGAEDFKGEELFAKLRSIQGWLEMGAKLGCKWRADGEVGTTTVKVVVADIEAAAESQKGGDLPGEEGTSGVSVVACQCMEDQRGSEGF